MILDSLHLHNYGLYKGEHNLTLSNNNERKTITLIGGLNGAGKTTILEALQLALYGKQSPFVQDSTLPYDQLLKDRINKQVSPREGASVELCFRVQENGEERSYSVTRSWSARKGRPKERLSISVDGMYDEVLADTWADHAERFIPARLSPLFFFDGEKIEALADPERSTEAIRTAMEALLGLDIISQLSADLVTLERRKIRESGNGNGKVVEPSKIDELEKQFAGKRKELDELKQKEASLGNTLDGLNKKLQQVQRKLSSEGGDIFEGRKQLEAKHSAAVEELKAAEERLRDVASGDLPLFLLITKLQDLSKQARQASEHKTQEMLSTSIKRHDEELIAFLATQKAVSEKIKGLIRDYLAEKFNKEFGSGNQSSAQSHLDERLLEKLTYLLRKLPEDEINARRLLTEHEKITQRVQVLERQISSVPDEDTIAESLEERNQLLVKIGGVEGELKGLQGAIETATRQLETLKSTYERALRKQAEALKERAEESRLIEYSRKAVKTLDIFKKRLLAKHATRLGALVQESFSHLVHKDALTSEIRINPNDCTMSLFDGDGKELAPGRLSAGERQLLSVSLLWGLARAAGRPLPVVVDTPLGRLDGSHRLNLVQKYFPFASHQVLVLSTDEEIDEELLEHLKPYIGHSYLLEFHDDLGHSIVRPGYFEKMEAAI